MSGNARASSTHRRSRAERNTHMLRVPSLPSFRSASHRLPQAVLLPVFFDAFSARPVRGYAAAGRWRLPPRATRGVAP